MTLVLSKNRITIECKYIDVVIVDIHLAHQYKYIRKFKIAIYTANVERVVTSHVYTLSWYKWKKSTSTLFKPNVYRRKLDKYMHLVLKYKPKIFFHKIQLAKRENK